MLLEHQSRHVEEVNGLLRNSEAARGVHVTAGSSSEDMRFGEMYVCREPL
jgi:hypothetical protein